MLEKAGLHCIAFITGSFPLIPRVRVALQNLGRKNNHACLRLRPVSLPGLAQIKAHSEKITISELLVLEMIRW